MWLLATAVADAAPLTVGFDALRSSEGQLLVAVYQGADGFPGKADKAVASAVAAPGAKASFELPEGEYAVAVIHDENMDKALSTNFLGIPKEGVGASNNPKPRFGPPKYDAARFSLPAEGLELSIKLQYVL